MAGFDNDTVYALNVDFSGAANPAPTVTSNGQLLIGSSVAPNIRVGTLSSTGGSVTITNGNGTINLEVAGGPGVVNSVTGTAPIVASPTTGNVVLTLNTVDVAHGGTGRTTLTNHGVIVGAGTTAVTQLAAGSAGQVLQSGGASADPAYSTATYPSTATGTGTILRADGTNWVATTATYPATTTINQLLYSSSNNVVAGLTASNSSALVSTSAGVPTWAAMTDGQLIFGRTSGTPTAAAIGSVPGCYNIGIAYSGGTFTVQGSDGTAFSSTNPGFLVMQSKGTPGRLKTLVVTANQTFTDGSSGTTDNARFGVTTGVNWSNDIPFYLYAVMDDTEALVAFMISRNSAATTSPASTSISKSGSIINVGQGDFFSLANVTLTSYDSNPCVCLGSFRMQFVGATDSWTVQTLATSDGIGQYNDSTVFTFPTGQMGAVSGTYVLSNAGTEPVFNGNTYQYTISRQGFVNCHILLNDASTAGVGTNTLQLVLPYAASSSMAYGYTNTMYLTPSNSGTNYHVKVAIAAGASATSSSSPMIYGDATTAAQTVKNNDIGLTGSINGELMYKAY